MAEANMEEFDNAMAEHEKEVQKLFDESKAALEKAAENGAAAALANDAAAEEEAAAQPTNRALVFIKPHAAGKDAVKELVVSELAKKKINILHEGEISGDKIGAEGIIDTHYSAIHRWAVAAEKKEIREMMLPQAVKDSFKEKFDTTWEEATILTAAGAAENLGNISGKELADKWNANTGRMKLAPGLYVTKFEEEGYYVLNGFYLNNREKFTNDKALVQWFVVEWNEADLTWQSFRGDVIGPTDPSAAGPESIRGLILAKWEELGLEACPSVSDNGVHASAGPVEAFKERQTWVSHLVQDDPFEKSVAALGEPVAKRLYSWLDNPVVTIDSKTAPVFDLVEDKQTTEVLDILKNFKVVIPPMPPSEEKPKDASPQKRGSSVTLKTEDSAEEPQKDPAAQKRASLANLKHVDDDDAASLMPSRKVRPNRWLMRTPTPPPPPPVEDVEDAAEDGAFEDTEFHKNHADEREWKRAYEIYPAEDGADFLPEDLSFDDVEQGLHPDCFFISALSILCQTPELIRNLFVSKSRKVSGKYVFQFYGWDQWQQVVVDDYIPTHQGHPIHLQSPTKRVWPLLLLRAYAQFYKSYDNVNGGNLAEALHDMTGKPVTNVVFEAKYNAAANENAHEAKFWIVMAEKLQKKSVAISAGTNRELTGETGLQRGHAYGVLGVVSMDSEKEDQLDNFLVKLSNPFKDKAHEYSGPMKAGDKKWTDALKERAKFNPDDKRTFFMPVPDFIKHFAGLQVCRLEGYETRLFFHDEWTAKTAGGNPTNTTWRTNPTYVVMNRNEEPVNAIIMLKQADQRSSMDPTAEVMQFNYVQAGVTVAQHTADKHPIPTMLLTGNQHKYIHRGIFFNQREVSNAVVFPADTGVYVVPSTYKKGQEAKFMLIVYCEESKVSFRRLEVDLIGEEPVTTKMKVSETKKGKVEFNLELSSDVHILVKQLSGAGAGSQKNLKDAAAKAPQGDTIAQHYLAFVVYDSENKKVGGMTAAMNYTELSQVLQELQAGTYSIHVTCVKGPGTLPISISIWSDSDSKCKFQNEEVMVGTDDVEEEPAHKPLGRKASDAGGSQPNSRRSSVAASSGANSRRSSAPSEEKPAAKAPTKPKAPAAKPSPNKPGVKEPAGKKAPAKTEVKKTPAPPAKPAPKKDTKAPGAKAASKAPASKAPAKAPAKGAAKKTPARR